MDKTKNLKRGLVASLAIISILSACGNLKTYALENCTKVDENNIRYVNSTFVDINPEYYNELMRGMDPGKYYSKELKEREEIDKKSILFGNTQGMCIGGIQNSFIGTNVPKQSSGILQGLVNNKLVDGNVMVSNRFNNGTTLFPSSGEIGEYKPYNEFLTNWQMPFLKEANGYYSFNSDEYHLSKDYENKKFVLHKGARSGFFPFNSCSDDTSIERNRNLYFTAKIEIPFLMTTDGKVKNSTTGEYEDMVFNFSGDDDVWIFVDDTLVLDLGGVHAKQTGNINFAKNQVTYSCVYNEATDSDSNDVVNIAFNNGRLSQGNHTLKLFYMERAGGISNLFASFNLQSSGVKTNYIEKYTNKTIESTIKTGPVGETVELEEKQYEDKVLCDRPEEKTVTLKEDLQTFNFYYKNKYNVNVNYLDAFDGSKVSESYSQKVVEDSKYNTEKRNVNNYTLVEVPSNASGTMPHQDIDVTYYYKYSNAKVKVKYVDETTGDVMAEEELTGKEGDKVVAEEKIFDGYVLTKKPDDTTFSKKEQEITYYYKHKGKIVVNYVDKGNSDLLATATLEGIEGDTITSEIKSFDNYELVDGPDSNQHRLERYEYEVYYYYAYKSSIVVNYIDIDTNDILDKIEEDVILEGTIYEFEEKQFDYYRLVQRPEEDRVLIGKGRAVINFYYKKLKFNLKVDMNLKKAEINGNYHELNNKLGKIETNLDEANAETNCKIYYTIKVTNNEERDGKGILVNYLPEGYMALQEDNLLWTIASDRAYINIENIKPGETLEYELILTKKDGVDVIGTVSNKVSVQSVDIEETNLDDNEDKNDVVIMPRTGKEKIIIGIICMIITLGVVFIKIRKMLK